MHIHESIPNIQQSDFYSIANSDRAAAARRAAQTRKRLLRAGQDGPEDLGPEETALIGQWMDTRHSQVLTGDEERPAVTGKDPDFG